MRRSSRILAATCLALAGPLAKAEVVDGTGAEALGRGWLAAGRTRLSAQLPAGVRAVETYPGFHVIHLRPEGFIVTSTDDELEPVLAFSAHGTLVPDPENPLWSLLTQDAPQRLTALARLKTRRVALQGGAAPAAEAAALREMSVNKAKWDRFRQAAPAPTPVRQRVALQGTVGAGGSPMPVIDPEAGTRRAPVRVRELRLADGRIQLTHDAGGSVTILASYDAGTTWQVLDTGVVQSTWVSKQAVQETSAWYRVEADGLVDDLAVDGMRSPPVPRDGPEFMTDMAQAEPPPGGPMAFAGLGSLSDVRVAPLVQSQWSQSSARGYNCYNYYTPNNYVCGCVATALAQLMRYWQYPTAGIGAQSKTVYVDSSPRSVTTRGGNGSGGAYDWSAMPLLPGTATYNASQWQMIGALCHDAGAGVAMMYASGGSGAYMHLCASALTGTFQYAGARYNYSPANRLLPINSNLAAGHPVLLGISSSGSSGHAVVCDGFGYDAGTMYHHINFGWAGAYDAWYVLPSLNTSYNFNTIDTVIFNAFPTGAGELLTGRVLSSGGAPVQGATVTASASGQNYSSTTDSKGYYGVKVPAGSTYSVMAGKTGMNTSTRSGIVVGTSSTSACGNAMDVDFSLSSFSFSAVGLTNNVWLRWSTPTSCGMANNTVYIRHRTDRYPTSSSDGTEVYSGTAQSYEHTGVDSSGAVTNYYTIWGDNGSPYASFGGGANAQSCADSGQARLFWTGQGGEVYSWNLKATGTLKSSAYVFSGRLSPSTYWSLRGTADVDRDGAADMLWTGGGGEVVYWLLNADATLKSFGYVFSGRLTPSNYWTAAGFADVDRDGTADILWTGGGGEVLTWFLNADGTLKSYAYVMAGRLSPTNYWVVRGFADIDQDGTADILWTGGGGEVLYWMLKPDGTLKSYGYVLSGRLSPATYWTVRGFNDIDRDGVPDILWTGSGGEVLQWCLKPDGTLKSYGYVFSGRLSPATYWTASGFRDVDGDGTADILWQGNGGETYCWLLNSSGVFRSGSYMAAALPSPSYWTIRGAARGAR